jgi:hypothetical protein
MKYTEKLETLAFAISCVTEVHGSLTGNDGHNVARLCDCKHGITIRRLQDEALTTQCAIDAVARRGKKGGVR